MNSYTVGRGEAADIKLDDTSVSNCHLRISKNGNYWLVEDLQSTNGTFLAKGMGKIKITRESVSENDMLILGSYSIRVAELVASILLENSTRDNQPGDGYSRHIRADDGSYQRQGVRSEQSPSQENQNRSGKFSRYLRGADGSFKEKK